MPCYHPIEVEIKRKSLVSSRRIWDRQTVPCGSCLGCRALQARAWAIRCMHERQMHESAWFLTLTYSDEAIPENGSLRAKDLQGFFKAVRREYEAGTVRYFACGEYGDSTQRPHYHALLFGVDFLDRTVLRDDGVAPVWRSKSLDRYWPFGLSEFGTVTNASASYVAGYVQKKVSKKVNPDHYVRVDPDTGELVELEREFSRMSLRPAIGRSWIERYWQDVYPRDFVVYDGNEVKPPRYYDKWMDANYPQIMMEVREKRIDEVEDMSGYTLNAMEVEHKSRNSLFSSGGVF